MYASTATPNAYYICFEDGATSASSWNNDGDFNDDVYFVPGITCAGGGRPCSPGMPGLCGPGSTPGASTGVTCQGITPPAPTETCNGVDDNCNGAVDEGAPCPDEQVCDQGKCVGSCAGDEFPCDPGLVCSADGHCVDPSCLMVTCLQGQVCEGGTCKAPCDGVTCPNPQVCRVGVCLDPCAGVTCAAGQVCDQGVCILGCSCQPCAQGEVCDSTSQQCVDPACAGVMCTAGTYCLAGNCVDDCSAAACPGGGASPRRQLPAAAHQHPGRRWATHGSRRQGTSASSDGGGADATTGAGPSSGKEAGPSARRAQSSRPVGAGPWATRRGPCRCSRSSSRAPLPASFGAGVVGPPGRSGGAARVG